jgi:O-antigen/teichoic acid export membrane protein
LRDPTESLAGRLRARLGGASGSGSAAAAGLAVAQLVANGIAVIFTVVFARLLGRDDYGQLAALVSTFLILSVPGYALQVAAAKATATGRLGEGAELAATLERWTGRILAATAVLALAGALLREPIAALIGVDEPWAAGMTLPTGGLWLLLSLQRGALSGVRAYADVGGSIVLEQVGRLVIGAILVAAGLGVTGAYLGTPLAMAVVAAGLTVVARRRIGVGAAGDPGRRLRAFAREAALPIAGLTLLAVLQNVDVIVARHQFPDAEAGAYAAAAVAAKLVVWTAVGVGMYLLPEAARLAAAGIDARPVLARALGIVAVVAAPALLVFALVPRLLLKVAFGPEYEQAADALVILGLAMSILGLAYLAVQYLMALGRAAFLVPLGAIAAAEPVLLLLADPDSLAGYAALVLAVQVAAASVVLSMAFRRGRVPAPVHA